MHTTRILALAIVITSAGLSAQTVGAPWTTPTQTEVDAIYPDIEALYMDLHRNPELAFQETRTAAVLAARVKALGFEVATAVGRTGIVAVLRNGAGPTVMLRTELDALPVEEKTGLPFASSLVAKNAAGQMVPVMHACGHDLHMAAWAGTARLMAQHRDRWRGTLVMVGQPAEEGGGGASAMLNDGLFTRFPRPDFALSLHDDDTMPAGTIGYHPGFFRAMSDSVTITVYGRGGHAAMPHNTIDPVVLAARIVLSLQTIVARENNPLDPAVITVGSIHGGTKSNIIPNEVKLQLTVRSYKPEVREHLIAAIERIAKAESAAALAPKEPLVKVVESTKATYNDPALTERVGKVLRAALGDDNVLQPAPEMGAEDFSEFVGAGVPGVYLWVGAVAPARIEAAKAGGPPLPTTHSSLFAPDREPTLRTAVLAETLAALELIGGK